MVQLWRVLRTEERKNPVKVSYGIATVCLPDRLDKRLKLIVVRGFGKKPMVLLCLKFKNFGKIP